MDFSSASYDKHRSVEVESELMKSWANENTVDYWRHLRMYQQVDALLTSYPGASWLTIGDGRFGTDAHYLSKSGARVIASDINDSHLKIAKQEGYIADYKVENAESLSFGDQAFDFVLCKESYHHFPRPALALYEMLRVSRKAVVLIEPNDQALLQPYRSGVRTAFYWFIFSLKQWIKHIIGKRPEAQTNRYETVGNYVYAISIRELEKVALGLNLDAMAIKGINDYYVDGVEYEDFHQGGPLLRKVRENIQKLDRVSEARPETFGMLVAIIFKTHPGEPCIELLRKNQFEVTLLEKNPYIKS